MALSADPVLIQGISSLPVEVKVNILASLPDRASLLATILTSKAFHDVFLHSANIILADILLREISPSVLTDALWCWAAIPVHEGGTEAVDAFLRSYDRKSSIQAIYSLLSMNEMFVFARINSSVRYWTARFCQKLESEELFGGSVPCSPHTLTQVESERIQRTLYRYELYSLLFRTRYATSGMPSYTPDMCFEHRYLRFFSKFNALEIDQFITVYDLLVDSTTHSFYDRCVCNVEWGWFSITPAMTSPYCFGKFDYNERHEQMVSQGLECLRRMETANSKEECPWTFGC